MTLSFLPSCLPSRGRSVYASPHLSRGPVRCSGLEGARGHKEKRSPHHPPALRSEGPGVRPACARGCCHSCPRRGLLGDPWYPAFRSHSQRPWDPSLCGCFGCPTRGPFPRKRHWQVFTVKGGEQVRLAPRLPSLPTPQQRGGTHRRPLLVDPKICISYHCHAS